MIVHSRPRGRTAAAIAFCLAYAVWPFVYVTSIRYPCAVLSAAHAAPQAAAPASKAVANPPLLVVLAADALVRLPDGNVISVPAGAEIAACGATPLVYELDSRTVRLTAPCASLFADGFE